MDNLPIESLINKYNEIEDQLHELGSLYDNTESKPFSDFQKAALKLHSEGYEIDEQIYDCYAEQGYISRIISGKRQSYY